MNNIEKPVTYNTIHEIRQRKDILLSEMEKDNENINKLWKSMFHNPEPRKKGLTLSSVMNTGTGLLDGFLFVWKLYRKFKR